MKRKKEAVYIDFRYTAKPKQGDCTYSEKRFLVGLYDTLEEAVAAGNEAVAMLAERFEVRDSNKFEVKGLFGLPQRLVSNACYTTKSIQYFANIEAVYVDDLKGVLKIIFEENLNREKILPRFHN